MARTRAQRRRQTLYLIIGVAVTVLVLLFARDVTRSAHGAIGPRRSENRSFAGLTNNLIGQQNAFDSRLSYLLADGATLTRSVFAARLDQLGQSLPNWLVQAEQLRRPQLAHGINDVVAEMTVDRVDAYETLLDNVASALTLPSPVTATTAVTDPELVLIQTSQQWGTDRFALAREPGRVTLAPLTTLSATYVKDNGLLGLASAPNLVLTRGIGIAAVRVAPTPLPSSHGQLVLPPASSIRVGVSVVNAVYVVQPVSLQVTFVPSNGPSKGRAINQVMRVTMGPLSSYAFVPTPIATAPSERGTLTIVVRGAPAAPAMSRSRVYEVTMSPSGA